MKWDKQIADMQMKNYGDASWLPPYKEVYMITFFDAKNKPCAFGTIEIVTYPEIGRNGLRDDLRVVEGKWSLTATEYGKNFESWQSLELYAKRHKEKKLKGIFNMGKGTFIDLNPLIADNNIIAYIYYLPDNYIKGNWGYALEPSIGGVYGGNIIGKLISRQQSPLEGKPRKKSGANVKTQ
jgi:hypothetical protein